MLVDKLLRDEPGGVLDDLVDPLAVSEGFVALALVHHGLALEPVRDLIGAAADEEDGALGREDVLCLLEGPGVSKVEEVKDAVHVDPDGAVVELLGEVLEAGPLEGEVLVRRGGEVEGSLAFAEHALCVGVVLGVGGVVGRGVQFAHSGSKNEREKRNAETTQQTVEGQEERGQRKIKRRVSRIILMVRDESGSREDQDESFKDHLDDER